MISWATPFEATNNKHLIRPLHPKEGTTMTHKNKTHQNTIPRFQIKSHQKRKEEEKASM
jgi:hypothetical protein